MTELRKSKCPRCGEDLDPISNYFNTILDGIGDRGSSFTDVDAATHDDPTDRFLFQEFKHPDEKMRRGQKLLLCKLARRDFITVWCVRKRRDGMLDWFDVGVSTQIEIITVAEYQSRFRRWWSREIKTVSTAASEAPITAGAQVTAADIPWGMP